eukprot:UN01042
METELRVYSSKKTNKQTKNSLDTPTTITPSTSPGDLTPTSAYSGDEGIYPDTLRKNSSLSLPAAHSFKTFLKCGK